MRRRDFIALIGRSAALPLTARAAAGEAGSRLL
jgi:hypothetical protein